jgi:hypothetical protein
MVYPWTYPWLFQRLYPRVQPWVYPWTYPWVNRWYAKRFDSGSECMREVRAWLELLQFGVSAAMQDMLSRPSASGTSVGPHHADDMLIDTSVGAHHTGETIAITSYNIGFNNTEVVSQTPTFDRKILRLKAVIARAFNKEIGMQALLFSEFGSMFDTIDKYSDTTSSEYGAYTFEQFQRGRIVTMCLARRRIEATFTVWMLRVRTRRRIRQVLDVKLSCKPLVDRIFAYL